MATDKKLFGVLQQFQNLIIFANDNGSGKNGTFIDADFKAMQNCVVTTFRNNPQLKEFFRRCVKEAPLNNIIVPDKSELAKFKVK